jgi:hypothetical protein
MENIVYILGAGFSAPLGLPVISNFLTRAKDLYFTDNNKYKQFDSVLGRINKMHAAKSYYNVDLLNIEEILSILEMEEEVSPKRHIRKEYEKFIKTVIQEYSPKIEFDNKYLSETNSNLKIFDGIPQNFHHIFMKESKNYIYFVMNLLRLEIIYTGAEFNKKQCTSVKIAPYKHQENIKYGIITLNYDLVIENILTSLNNFFKNFQDLFSLPIAKLHGSIDTDIVSPTWRKWVKKGIKQDWKLAFSLLKEATQIRIIGYSLPTGDNYIKYLLAAAVQSEKLPLKNIDIICLDDAKGSVQNRYSEFINFRNMRFVNRDVESYLKGLSETSTLVTDHVPSPTERFKELNINKIEYIHKKFFE